MDQNRPETSGSLWKKKEEKNKKLKSGVESESEQILSFLCNGSGDQSQKGRLLVIDYSFL